MSHTIRRKKPLLHRVARVRGQVDGLARALEADEKCGEVLRQIASIRGAVDGLMAEVLQDHIRDHAFRPGGDRESRRAAADVAAIIRSYLK